MSGLEPTITIEGQGAPPAAAAPAAAPAAEPSDNVTITGDRTATVIDARGRIIKVTKLTPGQVMTLFSVAGADLSANTRWFAFAICASSVVELAGDLTPFPRTVTMIQGMADRLGEPGMGAVVQALQALEPDEKGVALAAKN